MVLVQDNISLYQVKTSICFPSISAKIGLIFSSTMVRCQWSYNAHIAADQDVLYDPVM